MSSAISNVVPFRPLRPARPQLPDAESARRWFRGLLWAAFPAAETDQDLARRAARVLGVSEGCVRGWLRCDHDAKLTHILGVLALAGRAMPDVSRTRRAA